MSDYTRFIEAEPNTGCWLWTGTTGGTRYGRVQVGGRAAYAHRIVYEVLVGPIPEGLTLDHLCRTPMCINPSHLEPVSIRENILRGNNMAARHARKTECPMGHPYDEENTAFNSKGSRECLVCRRRRGRVNQRAYMARKKVS